MADAAVPDPHFRDQLADVLAHHAFSHVNVDGWTVCLCGQVAEGDDDDGSHARHQANVIAAEVESRIQAAANQRAAEELDGVADELLGFGDTAPSKAQVHLAAWLQATADNLRAAALASPAPALDAEEGR